MVMQFQALFIRKMPEGKPVSDGGRGPKILAFFKHRQKKVAAKSPSSRLPVLADG
jgi:hypothetical protein